MYTKEEVKEIVERTIGDKVERVNIKSSTCRLGDYGAIVNLVERDSKRVYFLKSYEYSAIMSGAISTIVNNAYIQLTNWSGVNLFIPIQLSDTNFRDHASFIGGGCVLKEFVYYDFPNAISGETYQGFVSLVYYECILAN